MIILFKLMKNRRSIRKFESREVEREKIDIILKSGLVCPSSKSRRPWEFVAVTDKDILNKLSECRGQSSKFLAGAPLGIIIIADPEVSDVWTEDCSITAIIMQLSAQDLGLGSCWIQVRERMHSENMKAEDYIKEVLGIPEKYAVECMVAIGYPAEAKKPYDEEELAYNKIHFNRY